MGITTHIRNGTLRAAVRHKTGRKRKFDRKTRPSVEVGDSPRRLNTLLSEFDTTSSYLEIGIHHGFTLEQIEAQRLVGVDPNPRFSLRALPPNISVHPITSDDYFDNHGNSQKFDVIFIDGLHLYPQVVRDLMNASNHLNRGGAILIDDTVPSDEMSAIPDQAESLRRRRESGSKNSAWHGDVWKILYLLSAHEDVFEWRTILGSSNPQTLVWLRPGVEEIENLDLEARRFQGLEYSECFQDGLPAIFNACDESTAINDWRAGRHFSDTHK